MARQFCGVPQWVAMYVSSLLCGYHYRAQYIESNTGDKITADQYRQINNAIDSGLAVVDPHKRQIMFKSIKHMTGYNNAYGYHGGKDSFYAAKAEVIRTIAKSMHVL